MRKKTALQQLIDKLLWVMATQSNNDVIHGINIAIGHAENALETEQAQNESQWISVDKRLPDEFESLNGIEMPSECRYACHRSGEHFESDETGDFINITHWQYATTPNE